MVIYPHTQDETPGVVIYRNKTCLLQLGAPMKSTSVHQKTAAPEFHVPLESWIPIAQYHFGHFPHPGAPPELRVPYSSALWLFLPISRNTSLLPPMLYQRLHHLSKSTFFHNELPGDLGLFHQDLMQRRPSGPIQYSQYHPSNA